jgi:hypothetical protein
MIKNVPNCIFYLHEFSNIFNQRVPIFLVRNCDFWGFLKLENHSRVGPNYQRVCRHMPRLDWLVGAALPLCPCLKGAILTVPHSCPSAPPRHFICTSPCAGRVIAPPPFAAPLSSAVLLTATLLHLTVTRAASSSSAGRRARPESSTTALLPFRCLTARPWLTLR